MLIGSSPGPVADEIAMGVRLDVGRQDADECAFGIRGDPVPGLPAAGWPGSSMPFQKSEKIGVKKGVPVRAEVFPGATFDLPGRGDRGDGGGLHQEYSAAEGKVRVSLPSTVPVDPGF